MDGFSLANYGWFAKFTELSPHQTFPLYGMHVAISCMYLDKGVYYWIVTHKCIRRHSVATSVLCRVIKLKNSILTKGWESGASTPGKCLILYPLKGQEGTVEVVQVLK